MGAFVGNLRQRVLETTNDRAAREAMENVDGFLELFNGEAAAVLSQHIIPMVPREFLFRSGPSSLLARHIPEHELVNLRLQAIHSLRIDDMYTEICHLPLTRRNGALVMPYVELLVGFAAMLSPAKAQALTRILTAALNRVDNVAEEFARVRTLITVARESKDANTESLRQLAQAYDAAAMRRNVPPITMDSWHIIIGSRLRHAS